MSDNMLKFTDKPEMTGPSLLLGFSGWMDGGEVSTGAVKWLISNNNARKFAYIQSEGFYIYNFPGNMETTALFRPHTRILNGIVEEFELPENDFFYDQTRDLVLFLGKEPNLDWKNFADCIFQLCDQCGIKKIFFIGSVAGLVPHTRDPSMFFSASDRPLRDQLRTMGLSMSDYEGPASFTTYLTYRCSQLDIEMTNLVAAVPAYVQGQNPKCIEAVLRHLTHLMDVYVDLHDLRFLSDEFEKRLTEAVNDVPELAESVAKLEEIYDKQIIDHKMEDLKQWLEKRGVSLD